MLEKLFLVFLIVLAIASIYTAKLRRTIIYLAIFSLVSSFVFLLYSAPDVAIAEAIIAAAVTTVLYLVAIKKHKAITIYFISYQTSHEKDGMLQFLKDVETFFLQKELEPQIIFTDHAPNKILAKDVFDYLIHHKEEQILVYGDAKNQRLDDLEILFRKQKYEHLDVLIVRCEKGVEIDA